MMKSWIHLRRSVLAVRSVRLAQYQSSASARHSSTSTSASKEGSSTTKDQATDANPENQTKNATQTPDTQPAQPKKKKSILQQDEELRAKMSGLAGDGGDAGVEYEDGQPVSMKRSVRNNMFRYI